MAALSSCSVYRSGQTPDDVYYSPGRSVDDSYLTVDNNRKGSSNGGYNNSTPDDNYLRMRVQNRYRWSTFDNYAYMNDWQYNGGYYGAYSPYTSGYYGSPYGSAFYGMPYGGYYNPWSYGSYWNSYYAWNSYYNPYCNGIIVGSGKTNPAVYQSVRNFNMTSYSNNNYNNRNTNNGRPIYTNPNGRYNTSNNNGNTSGGLRRVYSNSNDSYYTPNQRSSTPSYSPPSAPVRSYSPSSGGSSGGSGGGTGSGGARPSRGG